MTINANGKLIDLSTPKVMGILNVTPDSFYDGGKYTDEDAYKHKVDQMLSEGADILDVGGMSSRPGAAILSVEEELGRVIPVIKWIYSHHENAIISIDTLHGEVARQALLEGAHIINDISGGTHDPDIIDVAISHSAPYVLMHMQGKPATMQQTPTYSDVVMDVIKNLSHRVNLYRSRGLSDIIVDPGFGFGKTIEHNYSMLKSLGQFGVLGCPILAGISRKSMIYKPLNITPDEALYGTSALHMVALQQGANILRVHDVKEAKQCRQLYHLLSSQ